MSLLAFMLGPPSFCSVSERENAHYRSSASKVFSNVKRAPDHICAVAHDIQTHSCVIRRHFRNPFAVILNRQGTFSILRGQTDNDVARMSVLDRIVHAFSRDVVKVCRRVHVVDQYWRTTFEAETNSKKILH